MTGPEDDKLLDQAARKRFEPTVKAMFHQVNSLLAEKMGQGNVIRHNLEKGLGGENILREVLESFLPSKYGVAKGKIVNYRGWLSRHCDVIIYDRINCPRLFVDENGNQIIPIDGVYSVIEVKATLTKKTLDDAFQNLDSIYNLRPGRPVKSTNEKVDYRPPFFKIFGYGGLSLKTISSHYQALSTKYPARNSGYSYSERSPAYVADAAHHLVSQIVCLGRGSVYEMLDGSIRTSSYGPYTLGMFLTGLLADMDQVPYEPVSIYRYFNWIMVEKPDEYFSSDTKILGSNSE
ncbi:DUF6602 domain-containing protein [Actinoplanes sp. NPDC049118]|uniref:DUF6602 domain-containing protein n=1 Tax=Actinoplanes sp. NPDC049118 TaxID=3155769 RepID=UPI0033C06109